MRCPRDEVTSGERAATDGEAGEDGDGLGEVWPRRRRGEISERIQQLWERAGQLADRLAGTPTSPQTLADARAHLAEAKAQEQDARARAAGV